MEKRRPQAASIAADAMSTSSHGPEAAGQRLVAPTEEAMAMNGTQQRATRTIQQAKPKYKSHIRKRIAAELCRPAVLRPSAMKMTEALTEEFSWKIYHEKNELDMKI